MRFAVLLLLLLLAFRILLPSLLPRLLPARLSSPCFPRRVPRRHVTCRRRRRRHRLPCRRRPHRRRRRSRPAAHLPSPCPPRRVINISTKRKLSSKKELDDFTRASIKIDLDVHLPELVTSRESRTFCAVSP